MEFISIGPNDLNNYDTLISEKLFTVRKFIKVGKFETFGQKDHGFFEYFSCAWSQV